jgi:hypothetical protein
MEPTVPPPQSNGQQFVVRCSEYPYRVRESPNAGLLLPLDEHRDVCPFMRTLVCNDNSDSMTSVHRILFRRYGVAGTL